MKKPKCVVCGQVGTTHNLPHGKICLCGSFRCFQRFCLTTQNSIPAVWVGAEDFVEHELLTYEEIKDHEEALIQTADATVDAMWDSGLSDVFNGALVQGAQEFEQVKILNTKKEELPLLLEHLRYPEENKKFLLERLKG